MNRTIARTIIPAALILGALTTGGTPVQAAPAPTYENATAGTWYTTTTAHGAVAIRYLSNYQGIQVRYQRRTAPNLNARLSYRDETGVEHNGQGYEDVSVGESIHFEWYDNAPSCATGRVTNSAGTRSETPTICKGSIGG